MKRFEDVLTKEQIKEYNQNHSLARKHFGLKRGDGLVLHHKDPELRYNDIDRYIQWNPEDLEVMTKSEHMRLHRTGGTSNGGRPRKRVCQIIVYDDGTTETITYPSSIEAGIQTGVDQGSIIKCCKGQRKQSGGFQWKYAD